MAITRTPYKVVFNTGNLAWTNMPAAETELAGVVHRRCRVDLTDCDRCRLTARVSTQGAAGSVLKAQYATADAGPWTDLTIGVSLAAVDTAAGAWGDVPAGAKGDVIVRVVGVGGNGTADPVIGNVVLEVR